MKMRQPSVFFDPVNPESDFTNQKSTNINPKNDFANSVKDFANQKSNAVNPFNANASPESSLVHPNSDFGLAMAGMQRA
jgi:hypothetical protein